LTGKEFGRIDKRLGKATPVGFHQYEPRPRRDQDGILAIGGLPLHAASEARGERRRTRAVRHGTKVTVSLQDGITHRTRNRFSASSVHDTAREVYAGQ